MNNKDNILMNEQEFLIESFKIINISGGPKELLSYMKEQSKKYYKYLESGAQKEYTRNDMMVMCHIFSMLVIGLDNNMWSLKDVGELQQWVFGVLMSNEIGYDEFGKICVPVLEDAICGGYKSGE